MKSTNRQFYSKLGNLTKSCLKMCLLNYILITLVTLTQSAPPAPPTAVNLSKIIGEHPEFRETLLNKTVVPFIIEECQGKTTQKKEMLCGSFIEMIKMLDTSLDTIKVNKLDASKLNDIQTLDGLTKALSKYNQEEVKEFCSKFPSWIPKDLIEYPESTKLYNFVNDSTKCEILCSEITDADAITVKPICRIFAIGFQFSLELKALVQQNVGAANKIDPPEIGPETDIQKHEDVANPEAKVNSTTKSDVLLNPDVPFVGESASRPEVEKTADDPNAVEKPAEKSADKVNLQDPTPVVNQNNQRKEEGAKLTSTNQAAEIGAPISKSVDSNLDQVSNPSKPQPSLDDEAQKQNAKPVTDIDENLLENNNDFDDANKLSEIDINNKDKSAFNDDDSTEELEENKPNEDVAENVEDEIINVPHKIPQDQPPSREQLLGSQNEDPFYDDTDSNFFTYFMFLLLVCVIAYVVYHNKTKMLALMLEGRRSSTSGRSGLSRRKHTAAYRKLDSNLEEAITSSANGRSTQVIY